MNPVSEQKKTAPSASFWDIAICTEAIVLAGVIAYGNSFFCPLIHDDLNAILNNGTIRHLGNIGDVLSPPHQGETVGGRPLLNLSLALNYAWSGTSVWSYHVFNLLIHVLAGLTLFGIVRRTLLLPILRERFGGDSLLLSLTVALLWTIHPLQTESVTYIVQRAESLMGLFYLLTLYCSIRGMESPTAHLWLGLAVVACLLGMATKEVMVTAPLIVFLYDRTFISGTFRKAWAQRCFFYIALASTWFLLIWLVLSAGSRGGSAVFSLPWSTYVGMQFPAIIRYLWLSFWPSPLVFDYGAYVIHNPWLMAVDGLTVFVLIAGMGILLWHRPVLGFPAFCFFAILAPTSSVLVVSLQTICEHRMYLSLAAVVTLAVLGLYAWMGRRSLGLFLIVALVLGGLTLRRNQDYRNALSLWEDTVAKCPGNPIAHNNLGTALLNANQTAEAIDQFQLVLRMKPHDAYALGNLGIALFKTARQTEAIADFEESLKQNPKSADTHYNYGLALEEMGRTAEAIEQYRESLKLRPFFQEAQDSLTRLQILK